MEKTDYSGRRLSGSICDKVEYVRSENGYDQAKYYGRKDDHRIKSKEKILRSGTYIQKSRWKELFLKLVCDESDKDQIKDTGITCISDAVFV